MMSHFRLMLLFAGFVSLVFALLLRDDPWEQARLGGTFFTAFVVASVVLGWLMYPWPL